MDSSSPDIQTATTSSLTKPQRRVANKTANILSTGLTQGATPYSGDRVASLVPGISRLQGFLDQVPTDLGEFKQARSTLAEILTGRPSVGLDAQATASYFKDAVTNPMLRTYDEDIAPRIRDAYAGQGGTFSTRRGLASQRALESLGADLAAQLGQAQIGNQRLDAELNARAQDRALTASNSLGNILAQPAAFASNLSAGYAPFQGYQQALLDSQYQDFLRTAEENNPYLAPALGFTNQSHQVVSQYTTPGGGGIGGALGGALGGGLLGLEALGGMETAAGPWGLLGGAVLGGLGRLLQ